MTDKCMNCGKKLKGVGVAHYHFGNSEYVFCLGNKCMSEYIKNNKERFIKEEMLQELAK